MASLSFLRSRLLSRPITVALSSLLSFNLIAPAFAQTGSGNAATPKPIVRAPQRVPTGQSKTTVRNYEAPKASVTARGGIRSLLNAGLRLNRDVSYAETQRLVSQSAAPDRQLAADATILLGELAFAARRDPEKALERFQRAKRLSKKGTQTYGLASYDEALALFYTGRYAQAQAAFGRILRSGAPGINPKDVAVWQSHATACAEYHARHAAAGITQPRSFDPLGGAAGLAIALQKTGKRLSREEIAAKVPHTGFGSSPQELQKGAEALGLAGYGVSVTDDAALRRLFQVNGGMPVIALVEHDHYVTLIGADASGVKYMCTDCGSWPGGERRLTWEQWHLMEATVFVATARPGTAIDLALASLTEKNEGLASLLVSLTPTGADAALAAEASNLSKSLSEGLSPLSSATMRLPVILPEAPQCVCNNCPYDGDGQSAAGTGPGSGYGPQIIEPSRGPFGIPQAGMHSPRRGEPVNLGNGQEEYTPGPDITVYNPTGPSVVWSRMYYSMMNWDSAFGLGWTHPYNMAVIAPTYGTEPQNGRVVFPNNAQLEFEATAPPNSSNPEVACTLVGTGRGVNVRWLYSSTGNYFVVSFPDRSKFETVKTSVDESLRPERWYDNVGNYIQLTYANYTQGTGYTATPRLTAIKDSAGAALLTFALDSYGNIQTATDRYSRRVIYNVAPHSFTNAGTGTPNFSWELESVSVIVPSTDSSGLARYNYGYQNYGPAGQLKVPFLHTIDVPNPEDTTPATRSSCTINYSDTTFRVTSIEDSYGNKREYSYPTGSPVTVTYKNASGVTQYGYRVTVNTNLSVQSMYDYDGNEVAAYGYGDPQNGFRPSTVTLNYTPGPLGMSRVWTYDWDGYGNLLSLTRPSGLKTTYTYSTPSTHPLGRLDSVQNTKGSTLQQKATAFGYDSTTGLLTSVTAPKPGETNGSGSVTTGYSYTALGNISTVTLAGNGNSGSRIISYGYTSDGTYSQSEALGQPITVTDPQGKVSHLRYTSRGQLYSSTDQVGNTASNAYNLAGQQDTVTLPEASTGAGHASTANTYQYMGGPLEKAEEFAPSGGTAFRTVELTYGKDGELLSRTGSGETVSYTYDACYRLKTLTDGKGGATTYTYDTVGRLTQVDFPGASGPYNDRIKYTSWDQTGNVLSKTDGNGRVTTYEYGIDGSDDALLSAVNHPAQSAIDVAIQYDDFNRPQTVTDGEGTAQAIYDDLGLPSETNRTYTGLAQKRFLYTYFDDGSRNTMTVKDSSGATLLGPWTYGYDKNGRCTSLHSPADVSSAGLTLSYFDNGLPNRRTLPNGLYTDTTWNGLNLPLTLKNYSGSSTLTGQFDTYTYDGAFNMTGWTVSNHNGGLNGSVTEQYDTKDRLTQEYSTRAGSGSTYTSSFGYDGADDPRPSRARPKLSTLTTRERARGTPTTATAARPRTTPA